MRNETGAGVFVVNYGVVPAGEEATVRQSPSVDQLIKDGTLSEVGSDSSDSDEKEGDA